MCPAGPPPMITKRRAIVEATDRGPASTSASGASWPRATVAWSWPAPCSPERPTPSPTGWTGEASSPDLPWWPARSSRPRPTSCSGPPAPTPPSAPARGRAAPADRCAATATRSSAARSTAPTPARGSLTGGWWKADGSSFCGGAARYYMDCHKPCGGCSCGGAGLCSGALQRHRLRLRPGPVRPPQGRLHLVPLRQLQQPHRLHRPDPVPGRHVHGAVEDRAQLLEQRRAHRQQHPQPQPALPAGRPGRSSTRWRATGTATARRGSGSWTPAAGAGASGRPSRPAPWPPITFGRQAGDLPVVGDWNGNGQDTIGIVRDAMWYLCDNLSATIHHSFRFGIADRHPRRRRLERRRRRQHRRVPQRPAGTSARASTRPAVDHDFRFGAARTDIPVMGDWNGDGVDTVGVFRRGTWYLQRTRSPAATRHHRSPTARPATSPWSATGSASAPTASACTGGPRASGTCAGRSPTARAPRSCTASRGRRGEHVTGARGGPRAGRGAARRARGRPPALPRRDPQGAPRPRASTSRTARRGRARRWPPRARAPMRTAPGVPRPAARTRPSVAAADLSGALPTGGAARAAIAGVEHSTLLAFLSTGCGTCGTFWDALGRHGDAPLPGDATRLVIVTNGAESESPAAVAELAPRRRAHADVERGVGPVPGARLPVLRAGRRSIEPGDRRRRGHLVAADPRPARPGGRRP